MYELTELKDNYLGLIVEMAYEINSIVERMGDTELFLVKAEMLSVVRHIEAEIESRENV